jgi:L-asparaginase
VAERRVAILHTGGTIGMRRSEHGYAPEAGYLAGLLDAMPELRRAADYELIEREPLLDSASFRPRDWLRIARDIVERAGDHDGFVVLHGTDTMAYTASALAFMLRGLGKPVVLTGSQIPLCELRTDARENLLTALLLAAADDPIPEVGLYFGGRLLRGCRAVKVSATGFDAFDSPNLPPLAVSGIDVEVAWGLVRRDAAPVALPQRLDAAVGALRLFPGLSAELVRNAVREPLQGLVLEAYGAGNAPADDPELLAAIAEASARGVVIVGITQCLRGSVDLGAYATGSSLARAGVVPGADLTLEAAVAKLVYLLSTDPAGARERIGLDLCGELSAPRSRQAVAKDARRG